MKKITLLFMISLFIFSCSDEKDKIYDPTTGQALVFWRNSSVAFGIPIGSETTINVQVACTALSNSPRTITVEVDEEATTLLPENYNIPSLTVVIPANSYFGDLVIEGFDTDNLTTSPELLVLKLTSAENGIVSTTKVNITTTMICPIPETMFVGDYLITEITPFVDGPTLDHNQVVSLVRVSETRRRFATRNYPNYCSPTMNFVFDLICNEVIISSPLTSTCACPGTPLLFGPATVPGTYDVEDDSEFFLTFTNDVNNSCGAPVQTTYRFTKQ